MGFPGLSISALGTFKDCPRCFWLEKNKKVKRPRGIFPSLPKGMDTVMKAQVEGLIATGQEVPALRGMQGAVPFRNRKRLELFRSWRTFQREIQTDAGPVTAWGELDDLIEHPDGRVTPWDYKTKGTEPDEAYGKRYYNDQLDMYHLILEGQGLTCTGAGYLSYGWPIEIINGYFTDGNGSETTAAIRKPLVIFGWKNIVLQTDPTRAVALLTRAVQCLLGPEPENVPGCEYCDYVWNRNQVIRPAPAATVAKQVKAMKKTKGVTA